MERAIRRQLASKDTTSERFAILGVLITAINDPDVAFKLLPDMVRHYIDHHLASSEDGTLRLAFKDFILQVLRGLNPESSSAVIQEIGKHDRSDNSNSNELCDLLGAFVDSKIDTAAVRDLYRSQLSSAWQCLRETAATGLLRIGGFDSKSADDRRILLNLLKTTDNRALRKEITEALKDTVDFPRSVKNALMTNIAARYSDSERMRDDAMGPAERQAWSQELGALGRSAWSLNDAPNDSSPEWLRILMIETIGISYANQNDPPIITRILFSELVRRMNGTPDECVAAANAVQQLDVEYPEDYRTAAEILSHGKASNECKQHIIPFLAKGKSDPRVAKSLRDALKSGDVKIRSAAGSALANTAANQTTVPRQ
jgi:hypothetical protein